MAELDRRAADIAQARAMTEHALRCRAHDITECPRFRSHVADVLSGEARWLLVRTEPSCETPARSRSDDASTPRRPATAVRTSMNR